MTVGGGKRRPSEDDQSETIVALKDHGRPYKMPQDQPVETGDGPPPSGPTEPDKSVRTYRAKRHNEHVKAAYALTNAVGVAIIGAAYILPEIQGVRVIQVLDRPAWIGFGIFIIAVGHAAIRWGWKKED